MSKTEKLNEEQVFKQEVSDDELDAVSGGVGSDADCSGNVERDIYGGAGFPNCTMSVEDGSMCFKSDACFAGPASYYNMKDCFRAWE